jgi:hypothetical protein
MIESMANKEVVVKAAMVVARERAEAARRYALMFPEMVHEGDGVYRDIAWQYENEGIKAVHPLESRVEK